MARKKQLPKIGSKMYAIHKKYIDENLNGRMVIGVVRTYERVEGKIRPVLTFLGQSKHELNPDTHYIFEDLEKCIKLMTGKTPIKKKADE